MKIEDRLNQAVEQNTELENSFERFFNSAIDLGKEIAARGARGETLTDREKAFLKDLAIFMLRGLSVAFASKTEGQVITSDTRQGQTAARGGRGDRGAACRENA